MASSQCNTFLVFLIILFSFIQIGESMSCYNCTEALDANCKDPYKKAGTIQCPYVDQVCVKHKIPSTDLKITGTSLVIKAGIMRGCRSKDYCTSVKDYSDYCSVCTKDLCNNSAQIAPPFIILMILSIKNCIV